MEKDSKVDRRRFLSRLGMLSGFGLLVSSKELFGGGNERFQQVPAAAQATQKAPGTSSSTEGSASASSGKEQAAASDFTCTDVSGLDEQQRKTREALQYVDDSPKEDQRCNNCQFYVLPEGEAQCGTCQTVPGPIHPQGYCLAWVAKS